MRSALWSASLELCRALLQEGRCAFLLIFCPGAKAEERSLQRQALILARFHSLVHRFERVLDRNGSVGKDLLEDRFSPRNHVRGWNDLVDEADAVSLLGADHFPRENELQCPALSCQARQALRPAAAGNQAQGHFRLSEFGGLL